MDLESEKSSIEAFVVKGNYHAAMNIAISALNDDAFESILKVGDYLPVHAFNAIIEIPFPRYAFIEIQDYLDPVGVAVVVGYIIFFTYMSYRNLVKRDFN